ncbi:DoxX family membrane protein [Hymenobacter volaticus]|uniref:DoxX family membrane protein n=1 Tax=Hymenobacter volaticus TaxID=2932254 RepID=A0ABY4GEX3_9BACT|nr:DoxX family membrane protein [Hymenobacter volaticus]UOQ69449.1 DoxX family membrane protein [Hymenobacter volaticus]
MLKRPAYIFTFARLALGIELLSAVADRLGLWGAPGHPHVAWGDWSHFVAYTAQVNSYLPLALIPALAVLATAAELVLGTCLLLGLSTRLAARGTGLLTLAFALAMTISFGPKAPLDYSVWANVAAGLLLSQAPGYPGAWMPGGPINILNGPTASFSRL